MTEYFIGDTVIVTEKKDPNYNCIGTIVNYYEDEGTYAIELLNGKLTWFFNYEFSLYEDDAFEKNRTAERKVRVFKESRCVD